MDFRHIRAFIAVADALSVTKAAERLHISQPPLSRHIHQLEHELGVTLFVRHRQGVTLTDAGRRLLDKARTLEAAASDFYDAAKHATSGTANKIGIGIGWGLWDVVNSLRVEFAKQYPNVTIEARDAYCSDECNEQLRNHTLDLVFARPPFDRALLDVVPIIHERIQVAISADHPLASSKGLRIRDLASEPLLLYDRHVSPVLYDKVLDLYARAGVTPRMIPTPGAGPFNHSGLMLVASGKGIYLCLGVPLTSTNPTSGVSVVPLIESGATIEVCVASRRAETSPIVSRFLDCVWQKFPQDRREVVAVRQRSSMAV